MTTSAVAYAFSPACTGQGNALRVGQTYATVHQATESARSVQQEAENGGAVLQSLGKVGLSETDRGEAAGLSQRDMMRWYRPADKWRDETVQVGYQLV